MTEPVGPKKEKAVKTVPESDFVAFKRAAIERERRLKAELEEARGQVSQLQSDTKFLDLDVDDSDGVNAVKRELLRRERELNQKTSAVEKREAGATEKERLASARMLVADYQQRGLDVDVDSILAEENPELYLRDKMIEHLLAEKETSQGEKPSETEAQIYESIPAATNSKIPTDYRDDKAMSAWEADLKAKAAK